VTDEHADHECAGPGLRPECNQRAASEAFEQSAGRPAEVCPTCGQPWPDQPVRMTESFSDWLHPRAAAGSPAGGQFSAGGGGTGAKNPSKAPAAKGGKAAKGKAKAKSASHHRAAKAQHSTLGLYAGYGQKNGSPKVKTIQAALNARGFKDAQGHALKLDGKLGPKTTAAIKAAQRSLKVPATGKVTPALLRRLTAKQKTTKAGAMTAAKKATPAKVVKAPAAKPTTTHISVKESGVATEAFINGQMAYDELRGEVEDAVRARMRSASPDPYAPVSCYVVDLTDTDAVYMSGGDDLYQCSYSVDDAGTVTLGDPELVVKTYAPAPQAMADEEAAEIPEEEMAEEGDEMGLAEAEDRIEGRVIEAAGTAEDGGRIFRVRIIAAGDSKNGRRYPHSTLADAAPMYSGAKAYDHHRTEAELKSSTIGGIVGHYRDVEAKSDGLYGNLHLLPSATHAAEALDTSLALQKDGMAPLIGISHDVMAKYRPITASGRRMQEATQITKVHSADLVADPAAGGKATRMVAGGTDTGTLPEKQEDDVPPTKEDFLAAMAEATDEELAGVGLARAVEAEEIEEEAEREIEATSVASPKAGWMGQAMIREKVKAAGLPEAVTESLTEQLPDRITEADVDARVAGLKTLMGIAERVTLDPGVGRVQVTQESVDKKRKALDAFFDGDYANGYRSFKEAYADFTGNRQRSFDEDYNRTVLRESIGSAAGFDSRRAVESADSTTWNLVLGDSITRRLVAEYSQPSLQTWRQVVSSVVPVQDFRTQRIDRIGGYGTLPAVNQGAPYQPLTTPTNEEITYAITKRGGTEDLTIEMIANDDVRAIAKIPVKLGLAAAQTLFRFVWELLNPGNNPTIYDGAGLWTGHSNSATVALSQTNLSAARKAMRSQAAYGDTADILSIVPKLLFVCNTLEELAFQLCTSAVAIPATPAGPSNTPNIHQGLTPVVVDYWTTTTGWGLVADPNMCPTIEMGFYQGRETPELLTQSDPSVGSVFDADKVTYKIRHIYSGAVLDFRGLYRGNT
jgi:peptidoglycan hydrolase-like protein with peptidoglycan-binding domain